MIRNGLSDRRLGRNMGGLGKIRIRRVTNAACVDYLEGQGPGFANSGKTIPSNARLIMDDGDPATHETVKEG